MGAGPILIIAGTNRPGSNTLRVAHLVERHYKVVGAPVEVFSLRDLPPEMFDPGSYAHKPPGVVELQRRVLDARGLHIVTPEYNGSFPGVLKYFIDMLKFPESFEKRPVCFVGLGAGMWGALRPVEQLQMIFGYRNAFLYPERVFLPGIGGLLTEQGAFTDADIAERLRNQATGYIEFVERLKGVKLRAAK